jgi:hypothetical protein
MGKVKQKYYHSESSKKTELGVNIAAVMGVKAEA